MQAIRIDAPDPDGYLDGGKPPVDGLPNAAFVAWAKRKHLSTDQAFQLVAVKYPLAIHDLAMTEDRSAIPILRLGLNTHQMIILFELIDGLAELHDTESAAEIARIADSLPKGYATEIACKLVYFDDPVAQATALRYLGSEEFQRRRARAQEGHSPLGG